MTARTRGLIWIVAVALTSACGQQEPASEAAAPTNPGVIELSPAQVEAAEIVTGLVEPGQIRQTVNVPGSVQSPDTARSSVGSIVEGRVASVLVVAGDRVREGQALVEIHAHELAEAQRDLTSAQAQFTFRRNALERSEALLEAGAVSLEEVERRRADFQAAEAEVVRSLDMVRHLHPSTEGDVTIVAPSDGTVFTVAARPGQAVLPGMALVEMGSTDVLWVTAFVPESTASTLVVGDMVTVRFSSPVAQIRARLVRSSDYVDAANRSVEMRFELEGVPPGVRPGSFAVVEVTTSEAFEGVELDEEASVRVGGEDVVFVVEGAGRYRAVPVEVVPTQQGRIAIRGIPEGAEIVTSGAYFLKAAMELAAGAGS